MSPKSPSDDTQLRDAAAVVDHIKDRTKSVLDDSSLQTAWSRINAAMWEQGNDAFKTPAMDTHFLALSMHGQVFADIDFDARSGRRMAMVVPGKLCYVPAGHATSVSFEGRFGTFHMMIPRRVFDDAVAGASDIDLARIQPTGFVSEVDLELTRAALKLHVLLLDPAARDGLAADELAIEISRRLASLVLPQVKIDTSTASITQIQTQQAFDFIEANVFSDYALADIAEYVGVEEARFSKAFEFEAGQSLSSFRAERRLDFVRDWVTTTDQKTPAALVAQRAGYASVEQLDRAFRSTLGISFENYRADRYS